MPACGTPTVLGRLAGGTPRAVVSGRFVAADIDDLLVAAVEGTVRLAPLPGRPAQPAHLYRLTLYRQSASGLVEVWRSELLLGSADSSLPGPWTGADLDQDGRSELLVFLPDSCLIVRFDAAGARQQSVAPVGVNVAAAAWCDLAGDGNYRLVTLEPGFGPTRPSLLHFWDWTGESFVPAVFAPLGFDWGDSVTVQLLGAVRLDDYSGQLPMIAGIYRSVRPSRYGIIWQNAPGSVRFTSVPFPWREWFSKTEVLPAGRLELFNVGDTLVAAGYFVPGQRTKKTERSFAALQDGVWRLLSPTENAAQLAGPVCRFTWQRRPGWLEARDGLLFFYDGEIFHWR